MRTKNVIVPVICAVAGTAIGFAGGFIFAKAKYKKHYQDELDKATYEISKKEAAMEAKDVVGTKPTEEEAKEIAKDFPTELWTEQFKKQQHKRKDYKNLVRKEGYFPDEDGNEVTKKDAFDEKKFDEKNYDECKQKFEEDLKSHAEYSGISEAVLMEGVVRIIPEDEYYEETHDSEPIELEWDMSCSILRDIEGNILEPEITFGEDWDEILRRIEERPDGDTWVYDERLDLYYCACVSNARNVK